MPAMGGVKDRRNDIISMCLQYFSKKKGKQGLITTSYIWAMIFSPEQESLALVNVMHRRTIKYGSDPKNYCFDTHLTLTEMRLKMLKEADAQRYYVQMLCDFLDNSISRNNSIKV